MPAIIDTPTNVTGHLAALKAAGVHSIIRYDDRLSPHGWKQIQPSEAKAIKEAGLQLGIVYEGAGNRVGAFTQMTGIMDARYSRKTAVARGQPGGSAIYFAVDFDASHAEILNNIIPYFKGVASAFAEANTLPHLRVGVYGSGMVCRILKERGLCEFFWITCSMGFAESRDAVKSKRYDLWQSKCDTHLCGLDVDFDEAHADHWGQFVPWAGVPITAPPAPVPAPTSPPTPPVPAPPSLLWPVNAGPQKGEASWYSDNTNASGTPVNNGKDMTAAHRKLPFGTKLKVTRTDRPLSVIVTVEDRGPYTTGRIIDLRPAAAHALDMMEAGVVPVNIQIVP